MKTDNWEYRDIPLRQYSVNYETNPFTGEIRLITEVMGKIEIEVVQTKSNQLRNALIDLGWTPPHEGASNAD